MSKVDKRLLCLSICVCFAIIASERIVPLCNFTQEYGSEAEVGMYFEGLQERVKQGLLVRVYFVPETNDTLSHNGKNGQGEVLFCPLTSEEEELGKGCTSNNSNYEFGGIQNDTFNLKIKAISIADEGLYVLNPHTLNTTECRLELSNIELTGASTTTTYKTAGPLSTFPSNKSSSNSIKDAADNNEDTTSTELLVGVIFGVAFTAIVISVAAFLTYKRCSNSSDAQQNTGEDAELGENNRRTNATNDLRHDSPTMRSANHATVSSDQSVAVDQEVNAPSLQGVSEYQRVSDTDEIENEPTDQQSLTGPMPDLERPHAQVRQVPSTSLKEAAPLLSSPATLDRSNGTSGAGQKHAGDKMYRHLP